MSDSGREQHYFRDKYGRLPLNHPDKDNYWVLALLEQMRDDFKKQEEEERLQMETEVNE